MKRRLLGFAVTLVLSGCIGTDALMPAPAREAQQELRREGLYRMSCSELRKRHAASNVPWLLLTSAGGNMTQQLGDFEHVMRKKGCRVPS